MKQGNWNYVDSDNHTFRTESFKDNTLVSNLYKTNAKSVDVSAFKQKNIKSFNQKGIKDLAATLSKIGNGEIIILADNSISIHFYYDKLRSKPAIDKISTAELKNHALQQTILFF